MKLKITDNLFLKILSVLLAIVLWLTIVNINDAKATQEYKLEVHLLNTEVITENGKVFRVEDGTNWVKVTVRERQSVLRGLKESDFVLTADMEKNLKYDRLVGINVECKNRNINVNEDVTLDRSNVNVSIEDSATEQFQIIVTDIGKANDGLMVGSMVPEQTIIKISGPVSIVERIEKVEAQVDVTGLPVTSVKNCMLKLYDSAGNSIDPTFLNFVGKNDGISVTVSMLHKKTVPLIFAYEGTPAENYKVKEVEWKPEFVEIAGNPGVLAGMNSVSIPAHVVNVDGIDEELQLVIDITPYLPSGVVLADQTNASVLVIAELEYVEPKEEEKEEPSSKPSEKPTDSEENTDSEETDVTTDTNETGENDTEENTSSTKTEDEGDMNNQETESGNNEEADNIGKQSDRITFKTSGDFMSNSDAV